MFIVSIVSAEGPSIGKQWIRDSYNDAVELVVELLKERDITGFELAFTTFEMVEKYQGYTSEDGDWAILIGMSESEDDDEESSFED